MDARKQHADVMAQLAMPFAGAALVSPDLLRILRRVVSLADTPEEVNGFARLLLRLASMLPFLTGRARAFLREVAYLLTDLAAVVWPPPATPAAGEEGAGLGPGLYVTRGGVARGPARLP